MTPSHHISRRRLLGGVALGLTMPYVIGSRAFGANERIAVGLIGVNNRGRDHVKQLAANVIALCDVDRQVLAREQKVAVDAGSKCDTYGDFRQLLDRKDIDAVVIATPDHWHALIAIAACEAGKDVYCEKPLTLAVLEGRAMVNAARRHDRVFQTGSQQRSDARFRLACELVRSGRLGKLERIEVGFPPAGQSTPPVPDCAPPDWLDYDRWLGAAPERPYNPVRVHPPHRAWRWWWDYSGGQMTNWGAHHLDIVQWALAADESGPLEVSGSGRFHPEHWFQVPVEFSLQYKYANGLTVDGGTQFHRKRSNCGGIEFIGSEGRLFVCRGAIQSNPPEIAKQPLGPGDVHLDESNDHVTNWLDCIRTRKRPICDVEIGHRSATAAHLGNLAIRTGRTIRWDPATEQVLGDAEAAEMLQRTYRAPWKFPA